MGIRVLDEEKLVAKKDVYMVYAEYGGAIFYYPDEKNKRLLHIVAEADYIRDKDMEYYNIFKKYVDVPDTEIWLIKPCPKTNVKSPFACVMKIGLFDQSPSVYEQIKKEYDHYRQYYRISTGDMKLICYADLSLEALCYFGTTIDPDFSASEFQKQVGYEITLIDYRDYRERYEILSSLNKEMEEITKDLSEPNVVQEIRKWVKNTPYEEFEQAIFKSVIGQPELSTVLASVYNYLQAKANGRNSKFNVIIAAPSGSGKTETFRAIRDYFKDRIPGIPLSQIDLTQITEEGFNGKNTNAIVSDLLKRADTNGVGIVWLDEFDKKLLPSYTSKGDNVNKNVQNQILTLVEGRVVEEKDKKINTENTLFIACGAFSECRKNKETVTKFVGFERVQEGGSDHYTPITKQDMIELGAGYELLGRFPLIVNFQRLNREAVDRVIDKSLKNLWSDLAIHVDISNEYREKLHKEAGTEYGCRQLVSKLTETVMPAFVQALKTGRPDSHEIWIDESGNARLIKKIFPSRSL